MIKQIALLFALILPAQIAAQEASTISKMPHNTQTQGAAQAEDSAEQRAVALRLSEFTNSGNIEPLLDYLTGAGSVKTLSDETRSQAVDALLSHTKPLPAANAKANMRGYQALSMLMPDDETYKTKAASYQAKYENQRYASLSKLKKSRNEYDDITWYHHPAEPRYADSRNYLLPYLGVKNGTSWLRFQLHYTSDGWLFIQRADANIDGKTIDMSTANWKRDNDTEIWEWSDERMSEKHREILMRIANSKKTIIRFHGMEFYDDWTVPARDKKAILDMFTAEEAMKEKLTSN